MGTESSVDDNFFQTVRAAFDGACAHFGWSGVRMNKEANASWTIESAGESVSCGVLSQSSGWSAYVYALIDHKTPSADRIAALMAANWLGIGSGGGALALAGPELALVVGRTCYAEELVAGRLVSVLNELVAVALAWRHQFRELS